MIKFRVCSDNGNVPNEGELADTGDPSELKIVDAPDAELRSFTGLADTTTLRYAQFRGQTHLVVPVVALVGNSVVRPRASTAPEFVPARELARAPSSWNYSPVVPNHPNTGSAKSPTTLESFAFGHMFNTEFVDNKLTTEVWLNVMDAGRVGALAQNVIDRINAKEPIEVSIGAWVTLNRERGSTSAGDYEFTWSNVVPDHLAMLPRGTRGACNNDMGCGPKYNSSSNSDNNDSEDTNSNDDEGTNMDEKTLLQKFMAFLNGLTDETKAEISTEPIDNHECKCENTCDCQNKQLADTPYTETPTDGVTQASDGNVPDETQNKPGDNMIEQLVGRLIANENSPFGEAEKAALSLLSEAKLTELNESYSVEADNTDTDSDESSTIQLSDGTSLEASDVEELRALATEYRAAQAKQKADIVNRLKTLQSVYTEDELNTFDVKGLQKIEKLAASGKDYRGAVLTKVDDAKRAPQPWGELKPGVRQELN